MKQSCELGESSQLQAKHLHSGEECKHLQVSPVNLGQSLSLMEGKIVRELSCKRKWRVSGMDQEFPSEQVLFFILSSYEVFRYCNPVTELQPSSDAEPASSCHAFACLFSGVTWPSSKSTSRYAGTLHADFMEMVLVCPINSLNQKILGQTLHSLVRFAPVLFCLL